MIRTDDFSTKSMSASILQVALPMMIAELVNVLYNIVDRLYLSHMPGVGLLALTGVGIAGPLVRLISGFANLGGRGGAPLFSIARGRGDDAGAASYMGNAFLLLLMLAAVCTAAGYIWMERILYWAGASADTYYYAHQYFSIYLGGSVFVLLSLGMNNFINAQGFGKVGMMSVVIGAVVNIALDPLFIFVFDMGVRGAAIATVIAQFCSALWVMLFLCGKRAILRLSFGRLRLEWKRIKEIAALGLSGLIMASTTSAVGLVSNNVLQRIGGDSYVAIMTVINSLHSFLQIPAFGLSRGAQPAVSYNYGARLFDRMNEGIRFVTRLMLIITGALWISMMVFPSALIGIFNDEASFVQTALPCVRIYFCALIFMAFQSVGQNVHVALGCSGKAIFYSMFRKVILVLPLMLLLSDVPALGVYGVFMAEPISEVVGGLASYFAMKRTVKRLTV